LDYHRYILILGTSHKFLFTLVAQMTPKQNQKSKSKNQKQIQKYKYLIFGLGFDL